MRPAPRLQRLPLILLGLLALIGPGCQQPIVDAPNPQPVAADEYRPVFDAAVDVLRDFGFQVHRRDYRFGRITTEPRPAPTAFEPWHPDNTTIEQAHAATLNDMRRLVTVYLEPDPQGGTDTRTETYWVRVEVQLERLQMPARRLTGTASPWIFSQMDRAPQELRQRNIEARYWEPMGRDPYLENRLLEAVLDRARDTTWRERPAVHDALVN